MVLIVNLFLRSAESIEEIYDGMTSLEMGLSEITGRSKKTSLYFNGASLDEFLSFLEEEIFQQSRNVKTNILENLCPIITRIKYL